LTRAEVLGAKLTQLLTLFADKDTFNAAEESPNGKGVYRGWQRVYVMKLG